MQALEQKRGWVSHISKGDIRIHCTWTSLGSVRVYQMVQIWKWTVAPEMFTCPRDYFRNTSPKYDPVGRRVRQSTVNRTKVIIYLEA